MTASNARRIDGKAEYSVGVLPDNCHWKIDGLFRYWQSIHPASGLPGRQHFDPGSVPNLLPNICLVDVPTGEADFTFRLMGTRLETFYGGNFTGQPFVNAYVKGARSRAYVDMQSMLSDSLLRWRRGPASLVRHREHIVVERLLLPLARDGEAINMILGLIVATLDGIGFD